MIAKLVMVAAATVVPTIYLYTLACIPAQMAVEDRAARDDLCRRLVRSQKLDACLIRLSDHLVLIGELRNEVLRTQNQFDGWLTRHNKVIEGIYTDIAAGISHTAANAFILPPQIQLHSTRGYFNEQHGLLRRRLDKYAERLGHLIQGHYSSLMAANVGHQRKGGNLRALAMDMM